MYSNLSKIPPHNLWNSEAKGDWKDVRKRARMRERENQFVSVPSHKPVVHQVSSLPIRPSGFSHLIEKC